MPDITMCMSTECPEYKNCYRAQANSSHFQSYSYFAINCNKASGFEDFIPYERKGGSNEDNKERRNIN